MQKHPSRQERESKFLEYVDLIVKRGGRCLVPMFALGRAQELLLILEEHWKAHPELQHIPIYYASQMASKALELYKTYVSSMNSRVQAQMGNRNPWNFEFIHGLKGQNFRDAGPCVVLASPGMLQHGMSRMLFERWAEDPKNGIIVAGYSVEGTLARQLLSSPREVEALKGGMIPLRAQVR
jgi:cleavage and polyadenylation specificity factor subunit 3